MRKIAFLFGIFGAFIFCNQAGAHTILSDANLLIRGTLPNARLDASSVAFKDEINVSIITLTSDLNTLIKSTAVQLSNLQTAFSTGNIHASNTNYFGLSGTIDSTNTWTAPQTFGSTTTFTTHTVLTTLEFKPQFTVPTSTGGYLWYSSASHSLNFADTISTHPVLQIGYENWVKGWNGTGALIPNGSVVYVNGSSPTIDVITIGLAKADASDTSRVLGITAMDIPTDAHGLITQFGEVHDIDTSQFTLGSRLFLSDVDAGVISSTNPLSPNFTVLLGYVKTIGTSSGTIFMTTIGNTGDAAAGEASDLVIPVRKESPGTITKGQTVYLSGYNNGLGLPLVELADADGAGLNPAIGIARESITNTITGKIVISGRLTGVNTSWATDTNDPGFLSTVAGTLQATRPTGDNDCVQSMVRVGRVHASLGSYQIIGAGRCNASPNAMIASTTSLQTQVDGKLDAGENNASIIFSTMIATGQVSGAIISSTNNWTAGQTFNSSTTFNNSIFISTFIIQNLASSGTLITFKSLKGVPPATVNNTETWELKAINDFGTSLALTKPSSSASGDSVFIKFRGAISQNPFLPSQPHETIFMRQVKITSGSFTVENNDVTVTGGTVTATAVSFSSLTMRNILYNPPPADGTNGQILATNGAGQLSWATDATGGGGGAVENSTRSATITVGGEIVYSSATPPFFPGGWWSAPASSCTITKVQAVVQNPSAASAVFPFYAVQQSSWQWSQYGTLAVTTATQRSIVKSEAIVVTSSNSFIVGVASAPVSNPASNLGLWFQYWCNP